MLEYSVIHVHYLIKSSLLLYFSMFSKLYNRMLGHSQTMTTLIHVMIFCGGLQFEPACDSESNVCVVSISRGCDTRVC